MRSSSPPAGQLNTERRRLPMVEIDKPYMVDGPDGKASLAELLGGRRRGLARAAGAPARAGHDAGLRLPRAPGQARGLQGAQGLDLPLVLIARQRLQLRLHVTLESKAPLEYNYRTKAEHAQAGTAHYLEGELPRSSYFLRDGELVFHTYSAYARGAEMTGGSYYFLDLTALGRQEDWEEPKGRAASAHAASPDFAA